MIAISPQFDQTKLAGGQIEDKIDVYEDQILGWLIAPAKLMLNHQHAGFAILTLALTYFEPLGQFLPGESSRSVDCFKRGFFSVYPNAPSIDDSVIGVLYDQLRCGMFHRGITKALVQITQNQGASIVVRQGSGSEVTSVIVNPWSLLTDIEMHVKTYCAALGDPADPRRRAFNSWFDARGA
jgi:hypothetical protein